MFGLRNFALLFALAFAFPAISQENDGNNMAKINLSAFAFKGFNVQYERKVTSRISVALGYGKVPTSGIPYKSFIEKQIDDPNVVLGDFRVGTSIFTPEIRFYFGEKGTFHGFYLAPYGRIGTYDITGPVNFSSAYTETRTATFQGKVHSVTGGLMIGSNFQLSNRVYLDWWIVGASAGSANGDLKAKLPLSSDEQLALQLVLNNIDVPFTRIQSSVGYDGGTIATKGTMVGLRGMGFNLGIRF
jgi:hypothetical protein